MSGLPSYEYRPTYFEGGVKSCSLRVFNEKRARKFAGGTFFRSIEVGTHTNLITIESVGNDTDDLLTNSDPFIVTITYDNKSEIYTIDKIEYDEGGPGPYHYGGNISQLRSLINANSELITMPARDTDINDVAGEDDFVLSAFSAVALSGGDGPPSDPDAFDPIIWTGPERAMCYINQSEINSSTGVMSNVFQTREFNGKEWIPFSAP